VVKPKACWKKGWGAPSPDTRNQRGSVWRPASTKEYPDGQDIYVIRKVIRHQVEEPFVSGDAVEVGFGEVNALKSSAM
jgi:hypothetical protein